MTKVTGLRAETSATSAIATLSVAVAALGHALAGGTVSLTALPQLLALAALGWSLGEQVTGRRWHSITLLALLQLTTHLLLEASHRASTSIATATAASASGSTDGTAQRAALAPAAVGHAAMGHSSMHDMAGMVMPAADASADVGSGSLVDAASGGVHSVSGGLAGGVPGDMAGTMHSGVAGVVAMSAAHLFALLVGVGLLTQAHRWVHRVAGIVARLVPQVPDMPVGMPGVRAALVGVPEVPGLVRRWLVAGVSRRGPPEYGVLAASY